ncbi:MAG: nucleotide-binding protein [Methanomicrobiales archaeon]|nr:nucleotide-binding protein [Methanomicrobiales archaeon]
MKIGDVHVRITALHVAVFLIFTIILIITYFATGESDVFVWGIPTLILLLLIPPALNYLSQKQYSDLVPVYEKEAKSVRIRTINLNMVGKPVRIEGIVERTYFRFLNRPQYLVADRTGEISVKMFTAPAEDIRVNDIVEVLGTVIRRYILTGDAVINCVSIRRIGKKVEKKGEKKEKEAVKEKS